VSYDLLEIILIC